jgi:exonuclease VII large subunit
MARRKKEEEIIKPPEVKESPEVTLKLSKEELLEMKSGRLETREKELESEIKTKDYFIKSLELKIFELQLKFQRIEEEKRITEYKKNMESVQKEIENLKKHVEDKQREQIPTMKRIADSHGISENVKWGFDPRSGQIKIIDSNSK